MQSLLSQIRQTTNARCACDQWINEKCQENVSIVKKDLCEEEGHEGQRKVQAEHKSQVRRRKSQCWKDHADLYLPHKDFTKEKKCVCVCVCVCARVCVGGMNECGSVCNNQIKEESFI